VIAIVLLSIIPLKDDAIADECHTLELNHYFDGCGQRIFSQWIFWEWNEKESRNDVVDWRMADNGNTPRNELSRANRSVKKIDGGYRVNFRDYETTREVTAKEFRETWTQFDPEVEQRKILPTDQRRLLTKPKRK
jgi:hypothetical protein